MKNTQKSIFYRHFDLSARFPVTALLGDTWISTPEPVKRLHFHNCMEIGYLYEGTGQVYIKDTSYPIKAPGIIIVPPNVPHYTQSDEDTICHWNWLYLDPPQMFSRLNPCISGEISRYQHELGGNRCVLQNKELERLLPLLKMVIRELDETAEYYQQIVIQLLESMFMLLLRNSPAAEDTHMLPKQPSGNVAQAIAYIS